MPIEIVREGELLSLCNGCFEDYKTKRRYFNKWDFYERKQEKIKTGRGYRRFQVVTQKPHKQDDTNEVKTRRPSI